MMAVPEQQDLHRFVGLREPLNCKSLMHDGVTGGSKS